MPAAIGKLSVNKLLKVAIGFITLDMTARAVLNLNVPNLPKVVPKILGLTISLSRLALLKPLTKGLPYGMGTVVNAGITISSLQMAMGLLPDLMKSFGAWGGNGGNGAAQEQTDFFRQ